MASRLRPTSPCTAKKSHARLNATHGQRYDVILDLAAYRSVFQSRRSLTPDGIYLMAGGSGTATWQSAFLGPFISKTGNGRVVFLLADSSRDDLIHIGELFEAGKVVPDIDACYPLGETGEAIGRLGESGRLEVHHRPR